MISIIIIKIMLHLKRKMNMLAIPKTDPNLKRKKINRE